MKDALIGYLGAIVAGLFFGSNYGMKGDSYESNEEQNKRKSGKYEDRGKVIEKEGRRIGGLMYCSSHKKLSYWRWHHICVGMCTSCQSCICILFPSRIFFFKTFSSPPRSSFNSSVSLFLLSHLLSTSFSLFFFPLSFTSYFSYFSYFNFPGSLFSSLYIRSSAQGFFWWE